MGKEQTMAAKEELHMYIRMRPNEFYVPRHQQFKYYYY